MKKTLYLKFLLAYLIFGFFGFLAVATVSSTLTIDHEMRESADSYFEEASLIAKTYANDLYNNRMTIENAYNELHALSTYMGASVWIVNPSGTVVINSEEIPDVVNPHMIKNFDPSVTGSSYYTTDTFFGEYKEDMLCVYAPITSNYKTKGYVVILEPIKQIHSRSDGYLGVTYITLVLLLFLSLIILLFFTQIVYLPLQKILQASQQYANGNMHYECNIESNDEMAYLSATLNYMANELASAEDTQKKFVANVSHDFRSPLTSIRGYLEAMIDGTIPPELHEKYLNIVLNETDRLTKLTNSLLTLNNLNTKGMILEMTDFDMNDMIRKTVQTFEGTCEKKHIGINLVLTGEQLMVHGDMGKIQQVVYNLLDNAIKFSHQDSFITIETRIKHNKVFTSVKDTGIGIPKESLKLVFDRFYKSDLSRGKDKKGTGLGLSITKEILHSHGENINVISTEGVGTEFIFTLPWIDEDELEESSSDE